MWGVTVILILLIIIGLVTGRLFQIFGFIGIIVFGVWLLIVMLHYFSKYR